MESDTKLLIRRRSNSEHELREAWLLKHQHAASLVFDEKTGVPHQAIYEYPLSTLTQEQDNRAFWETVRRLMREDSDDK